MLRHIINQLFKSAQHLLPLMNVRRSLLEDIKTKQLKWYGHVQRMEEGRLPKKVMK